MTSIQEALSVAGYAPTSLSMVEVSNQLVRVVEALITNAHDDADYCPSCGQNYYSTIGKTCCDECGSSCNLQGGCGSLDCINIGCDYDVDSVVIIKPMEDNSKGKCGFLTTKGVYCKNQVEEGFSACHAHLIMLFGKDYKDYKKD